MDSLYGDIEVIANSAETRKLQEDLEEAKSQCIKKDKEISDLVAQTILLVGDKDRLEINIMALFNTATTEIKRKDREIAALRAEVAALRKDQS